MLEMSIDFSEVQSSNIQLMEVIFSSSGKVTFSRELHPSNNDGILVSFEQLIELRSKLVNEEQSEKKELRSVGCHDCGNNTDLRLLHDVTNEL